jgi:hypothetical protein
MARTKNTPGSARSAARSAAPAAPAPAPAPDAAPPPGSPAGAACAALAASPGGATTVGVADILGIGRAAARDTLIALETAGTVTRAKGGKPGIPDTWTLTVTEPAHEPGGGPRQDDRPAASSQPGGTPAAADQDGPGEQEPADDTGPQTASDDQAGPGAGAAGQAVPADSHGEPDPGTGPQQGEDEPGGDAGPGPGGSAAGGDGGPAGEPPDPALVAEITGRIEQIQSAASAAVIALTGGGNLGAALAGMDEIYDQAGQARRALKAAAGGRQAPAARPGGLREKVLAHLRDHPGKDFTPHEIHKVLNHSSGAIANALDTLVKHGDAELATEKPRQFRLAGTAEGTGAGNRTGLAGAA